MNWYLKVLKQYADFNGRARRKEFWMFTLVSIIIGFILQLIDAMLGITFSNLTYGPIYSIYSLAIFIPSLAVGARRLHDTGRSGWMLLLWLFIIVGWIWLLVLMCTEGTKGPNRFGPDPKAEGSFNEDALDSHLAN